MRILLTVVVASLVSATPSFAKDNAQQAGDPQVGVATAASNAEKKVCKRLPVTGSRMTERVCLSKEDWKKVEEAK